MYFFSNSPVKWRLTKVVYRYIKRRLASGDLYLSAGKDPSGRGRKGGVRTGPNRKWKQRKKPTNLSSTAIADEDELECGRLGGCGSHGCQNFLVLGRKGVRKYVNNAWRRGRDY